jgi:hypothetical protein
MLEVTEFIRRLLPKMPPDHYARRLVSIVFMRNGTEITIHGINRDTINYSYKDSKTIHNWTPISSVITRYSVVNLSEQKLRKTKKESELLRVKSRVLVYVEKLENER